MAGSSALMDWRKSGLIVLSPFVLPKIVFSTFLGKADEI